MTHKRASQTIVASGHKNVLATHPSTLMITKERELSKQGDCVIAVAADKAVADLSDEFKALLRKPKAKLLIQIEVDDLKEIIHGEGTSDLSLSDPVDVVIRKSDFISHRTLALKADKAAKDLSREIVEKLKMPQKKVIITLTLETED